MIRPLPVPKHGAVLAVGADEAFNPIDVRMLHPDAVVLTRMSGRGPEAEGIRANTMRWGAL